MRKVIAIAVQGGGARRIDREELVELRDLEDLEDAPVRRGNREASARAVEAPPAADQQMQPCGVQKGAIGEVHDHRRDAFVRQSEKHAFERRPGGEIDLPRHRDHVYAAVEGLGCCVIEQSDRQQLAGG